MPYEPNSGLVFEEVVATRSDFRSCALTRCVGLPPIYCPPAEGPVSLASIAMRKLLCNLEMIDQTSLGTVPSAMLEKIWQAIARSRLDSLRIWQIFMQSSIDDQYISHNRKTLTIPSCANLTTLANHSTCAWITNLELRNVEVSTEELVRVSELENLRWFNMASARASTGSGFSDRILRTWAGMAREHGAFSKLKYIFLYFQEGVSTWSLDHLDAFPALDEFCTHGCKVTKRASKRRPGWKLCPENSFVGFIKNSQAYMHRRYTSGLQLQSWDDLVTDYLNSQTTASKDPLDRRPVLHLMVKERFQGMRLTDIDDIVCLKRSSELSFPDKQASPASIPSTKPDARPPLKKRKVIFDSTALSDML